MFDAPKTWRLEAAYFEGQIDLKAFRQRAAQYPVLATDPLIIEVVRGEVVVLTKFGAVVFWDTSPKTRDDLLAEVAALPAASRRDERVGDTLRVQVGLDPGREPDFNDVHVRDLTLEKVKVISLAFGQSVALDHFEHAVDAVMRSLEPRINALHRRGALVGSEREVLRAVGFALEVRAQVLANLTLFDRPPEAWESEAIERLDNLLYDHFDLEERVSAITQKLAFLNDLNDTFLEVLNHRKSVRLEWIVVILILVEVVMGLTGGRH